MTKQEKKAGLKRALGEAGLLLGQANERRVVAAFNELNILLPPWLESVRAATREEDAKGFDVIFKTKDLGPIFLNVKSSDRNGRNFAWRQTQKGNTRTRIIVFVVWPQQKSEELRRCILVQIEAERKHLIELRLRS